MKLRGIAGGLSLFLESTDTAQEVHNELEKRGALLKEKLEIEIHSSVPFAVLEAVMNAVGAQGGQISAIRSSRTSLANVTYDPRKHGERRQRDRRNNAQTGRTEIVTRTLRSGTRHETNGSVIVLGDVNPGVELIAGGDVIVVGTLRGLAHAGAHGRADAIIWAQRIASPQLRIAEVLARSEDSSLAVTLAKDQDGAELARLEDGKIVIEAQRR